METVVVKNLKKSFDGQQAVKGISFVLKEGEIVGFLGPNGAGKSTTMKMMTGSLKSDEGSVEIFGKELWDNLIESQKRIGYLAEHNPLYLEMYVREYLSFCADIYKVDKKRIEDVIGITMLGGEANKKIEMLSKGYRQRVGLAAAILHEPDILILDEPTTGLDPAQILEIRQIIRELGKSKTVLLSSHIMQEIQAVCDRVIIINKGEIVLDKHMMELANKEQTIEVIFDYKVERELLMKIDGLTRVENNYDCFYTLYFEGEEDKRGEIFDFAKENGLKILQINHKHEDLEDIFIKMTR